jgi:hypothetical protein
LLRLTYKIRPIEKQLPSATEVRTREEADLVTLFAEAYAARPIHPDDASLARRLLTHVSAEAIIAGLLRDHLGARKEDPKAAAAEARRARNPPPVASPSPSVAPEPQSRPSHTKAARPPKKVSSYTSWEPPIEKDDDAPILPGFTVTPSEGELAPPDSSDEPEPVTIPVAKAGPGPSVRRPKPAQSGENADTEEPGFTRIFLNVGRRDGARAQDLQKLLTDRAGITRDDTGRIRIRDRVTFVSVRQDDLSKAILALAGQVIGGRTVIAEPAKSKQSA